MVPGGVNSRGTPLIRPWSNCVLEERQPFR
ncbi:hypothetical protein BN1263440200 [Stenotrophomonas indicatrix]|nr:hypothetical protein BN1263440200 [Stenotrophomonas indicatrix]